MSVDTNNFEVPAYDAKVLEAHWQHEWQENHTFKVADSSDKPAKYVLEMFPYPSGDLHMGHARNYTIGDAMARHAHMKGFDVLHPIGFDAFGLPAENAAIKHKTQPATWTYKNIDQALVTMKRMGFSYDYDRMFRTCDPDYYRWGQWFFIQMYKKGLVFRDNSPVNWCNDCRTVLANEQVVNGVCWRCGHTPEKRQLEQWYFKITDYADELDRDLDQLSGWPTRVRQMQKNWIGKSEGAHISFDVVAKDGTSTDKQVEVFTTRPDTIFGVSFVLLSLEHPLLSELELSDETKTALAALKESVANISAIDRQATDRDKQGIPTGYFVKNPLSGDKVELWVADYVLMEYGSGAVMGVPAGDSRDFAFAQKYELPVIPVVLSQEDELYKELKNVTERKVTHVDWEEPVTDEGYLVQSAEFTGLKAGKHSEACEAITKKLEELGCGKFTVTYRLRDWLISRQRYWGNPIPMIHCEKCGCVPVPEEDLPVVLPATLDLSAGQTLAECPEFYETTCPVCGGKARRETDTMDTFTCSSWYYLRYTDPHNDCLPFAKDQVERFMPVNNYVGGIEHAILHLLYSRFWTKVARDLGMIAVDEPFENLLCQGMVKDANGETMSKSKGNVVPPSSVIEPYGADTMRLAILFIAPPEKDFDWDEDVVAGANRFIKRAWRTVWLLSESFNKSNVDSTQLSAADKEMFRKLNELGLRAEYSYDNNQFNTAISSVMELVNAVSSWLQDVEVKDRDQALAYRLAYDIVALLNPICPHWAEALYHDVLKGEGFAFDMQWPAYDEALAEASEMEIAVQVMGKLRSRIHVPKSLDAESIKAQALEAVAKYTDGKNIVKVIYVPNKLVNVVAK